MSRVRSGALVWALLIVASAAVGACHRAIVIVPQSDRGYTARDTLYGQMDGDRVRIVFHHDTTWRTDTVVRLDTLWRGGTRIIRDTVVVSDTVPVPVSITVPRRPTTQVPGRVDTVLVASGRVDTVRVAMGRVDTLRITVRDTVVRRDTVVHADTIVRADTIIQRDTVVVTGQRVVFVPPGQFPPAGQCRVWIYDRPPGQQARAAPCSELGAIPRGAFVLFDGKAYDADYDWVAESRRVRVPAEILGVMRGVRR